MRRNVNKAAGGAGLFARAFVVCVSLLSLCVSDGIGPRLLPFPSRPSPGPAARASDEAGRVRLSPSLSEQTRAASGHQPKAVTPVWHDASRGRASVSPPAPSPGAQTCHYASPGYSFRIPSSTRGRAPPRNS